MEKEKKADETVLTTVESKVFQYLGKIIYFNNILNTQKENRINLLQSILTEKIHGTRDKWTKCL